MKHLIPVLVILLFAAIRLIIKYYAVKAREREAQRTVPMPPLIEKLKKEMEARGDKPSTPLPPLPELKQYRVLTQETLQSIPDDDLDWAIYSNISTKVGNDYDHEYDTVMALSNGQRMAYSTWILEGEVNNGGFNQLFWNSSRQFVDEALEGYKLIGATEHAKLVESAIAIAIREIPDMVKHRDMSDPQKFIQGFANWRDASTLSELDDIFYGDMGENAPDLRAKYIRQHPEEFVTQ